MRGTGPGSFRVHSLKGRMIVLTLTLLAALAVALTYVSFVGYREDALARSAAMLQDTVEQVSVNIENYFDEINRLSLQLFYNSTVMEALAAKPPQGALEKLEKRRLIEGELKRMMILARNDILSCYIIADDIYRIAHTVDYLDSDMEYESTDWYHNAMGGKSFALLITDSEDAPNARNVVCSIVRRMTNPTNYKTLLGISKINFSYDGIVDICSIVQSEYSGQLCILSGSGKPLYGALPEGVQPESLEQRDGVAYIGAQPQYLVNQMGVPTVGWRLLLFHSVPVLEAGAHKTMFRMAMIALVCLLIASTILLMFIRGFLTPLGNVIRSMHHTRNGSQDERIPVARSDEIGYLAISFNEMLDRIKVTQSENTALIKAVYEAELLQRDIQMEVLSRQIEPHFIFNMLNMIAIEAQMGQTEQCVDNIGRLSSLLRVLAHNESTGTLGGELSLIKNYLMLYKDRYADRLSYEIDASDEYNQLPFPPLSLQPLVENAVVHGCEAIARPTHIRITARREAECLLLAVSDNACGIPPEKLKAICDSLSEEAEGMGIGIRNVHRRIKLFYGAQYGLRIRSDMTGTTVTLHIPLTMQERRPEPDV